MAPLTDRVAPADERPFPPGDYPVVIVGSGPGGLQMSQSLGALGIDHALLSADPAPGGMFRRFPFFQRLLSWTKPFAPYEHGTRAYEWYDWNSLLSDDPGSRAIMPTLMDGSSPFPSRPEMEANLVAFADRAGVRVRHACRWETTRRDDDGRFTLVTSDGEYRCRVAILAVGVAEPFTPATPGLEHVAHYVQTRPAETYADRRLFIIGKQNSGFELATGLLPWARQIILASPRPSLLSVNAHSLAGIRARYVQPWEDHIVGGGVSVMNASIDRVERSADAFRVHTRRADGGADLIVEADDVVAATGFVSPLRDLPELGVATFGQSRLPVQTPFWESATVPGIYFAGTITQGAAGLKKYGLPSNSGACQGYRYNARILARHVAETHFGVAAERPVIERADLERFLLDEATRAPELWNQKSYLARAVTMDARGGVCDAGIVPLADFVDSTGEDAVAIAVETDDTGDIHPAVYLRRGGRVTEHLMTSQPLHDFTGEEHLRHLRSILG